MIRIEQLRKTLGGRAVLRGVNLAIAERQIVALVGPSGTGKSVLLKHIIGLLEPDVGDVLIGGRSIVKANYRALQALRSGIGYVFQDAALLDSLTIRENLRLALPDAQFRRDPKRTMQHIMAAIASVNLAPDVLQRFPRELSGGMKKRAGVARAIINQPAVMLYDEPATGLDPRNVAVIDDLILRNRDRLGATSVVITHDLASVQRVADRVILLRAGLIEFDGTADEFFSSDARAVREFIDPTLEEAA
jgi:phospholipid/cholesterol/gamma-HCH transport system ATP-binding protein